VCRLFFLLVFHLSGYIGPLFHWNVSSCRSSFLGDISNQTNKTSTTTTLPKHTNNPFTTPNLLHCDFCLASPLLFISDYLLSFFFFVVLLYLSLEFLPPCVSHHSPNRTSNQRILNCTTTPNTCLIACFLTESPCPFPSHRHRTLPRSSSSSSCYSPAPRLMRVSDSVAVRLEAD
jgi:hypothetical protein